MNRKTLLIGKPRKYPAQLADALLIFFKNSQMVEKAYLAQVFDPSTGEPPHITLGVVLKTNLESISGDLKKIIQENCKEGDFIDLINIDTQDKLNLFSSLDPFYFR